MGGVELQPRNLVDILAQVDQLLQKLAQGLLLEFHEIAGSLGDLLQLFLLVDDLGKQRVELLNGLGQHCTFGLLFFGAAAVLLALLNIVFA